ncbi:unnamed protein product [Urochloa humidicola]
MGELACHVSENGKYVASSVEEWQICKVNREDGKWRGVNWEDGNLLNIPPLKDYSGRVLPTGKEASPAWQSNGRQHPEGPN